jgi:hypothetical protein
MMKADCLSWRKSLHKMSNSSFRFQVFDASIRIAVTRGSQLIAYAGVGSALVSQ